MRLLMTCPTSTAVLLLLLQSPDALAQAESEAITAQARISLEEIVPTLAELPLEPERHVMLLPAGWHLQRLMPGGFLLRHEDGSQARIVQCLQSTYYRVGWRIDYQHHGEHYVSYNISHQNCQPNEIGNPSIRVRAPILCFTRGDNEISVRIDDECRPLAVAITVSWPEEVRQQLLDALNPTTRNGVRAP